MSTETLQWKDLSLEELELVLKSEEVTGEPEEYTYIRDNGRLNLLNDESAVQFSLELPKTEAVEATEAG
ncbi:MAG: hypothetical protein CL859_07400 [Cyanobium sp. ARS6]|nr:hypothetical protein [Cyanobium sp. ARS6]